jgi:hypothetical protein
MRDAEPRQRLHEPRRSKLRAVVRGQNQIAFSTSCRQAVQHSLLRRQRIFGSATVREIPARDFPRAEVVLP